MVVLSVGVALLLLLSVGVLLSATVGVVLLVGVVSGAILPGSCFTSLSSHSSPSTLLLDELLGTWLALLGPGVALSTTFRGLVIALFLITAWIAPNHEKSGTLTSSSLLTLAPLLRSLSTTSLYRFFNAFTLSLHCLYVRSYPALRSSSAIFLKGTSLRTAPRSCA